MLNVIAGSAGGLRLKTIDSDKTKPTLGRVKEPMFSMIASYLTGATVLDLFAGSGSLGIEALSRGAEKCYFNDNQQNCCKITQENLVFTGLADRAQVKKADFSQALEAYKREKVAFDIVFLDPPYGMNYYDEVIDTILRNKLLAENGIIVAEHAYDKPLGEIKGLEIIKSKKYGTVAVTVYANR